LDIGVAVDTQTTRRMTMKIQRQDIFVAVLKNGEVYVAQGSPSISQIPDEQIADSSGHIWHSQLRHRVAYRTADGTYHVGTPTESEANNAVHKISTYIHRARMTGKPLYIGSIAQ